MLLTFTRFTGRRNCFWIRTYVHIM